MAAISKATPAKKPVQPRDDSRAVKRGPRPMSLNFTLTGNGPIVQQAIFAWNALLALGQRGLTADDPQDAGRASTSDGRSKPIASISLCMLMSAIEAAKKTNKGYSKASAAPTPWKTSTTSPRASPAKPTTSWDVVGLAGAQDMENYFGEDKPVTRKLAAKVMLVAATMTAATTHAINDIAHDSRDGL